MIITKFAKQVAGYLTGNRYLVVAYMESKTVEHSATSFQDAKEWAACYPATDFVVVYHSPWWLKEPEFCFARSTARNFNLC